MDRTRLRPLTAGAIAVALAGMGLLIWLLTRSPSPESVFTSVPTAPTGWNILLVSLDTTRPDRLAACGGGPVATPSLDRVARGGVVFHSAITPAPITLPAHASLLTGQNPYDHGVRENTEHALPRGRTTLATVLHEHGYRTAAFVSTFVLDHRFGLDQGFEEYMDRLDGPEPQLSPGSVEVPGSITARRAARWIHEHAGLR
ncbi:MAG: sulfatase-like hydrolase/transferase, partial [Candidatus Eisenbacteria bacterium]|nr:sulfatase-like hydrolase/transferase [Candidatus Eisenbacteria bacterium]